MTTLSLASFAKTLKVRTFAWKLNEQQETGGLEGGEILVSDIGPSYWSAKVVLDECDHGEAARVQSLVEMLDGGLGNLYFHDPRRPNPINDKDGTILGNAAVKIADVHTNNRMIKLKGLPDNYKLVRGDWLSFDFGTAPVHRAYHRVVSYSEAADNNGNTDWIEVRPFLLPGVDINDVVTLSFASALVKIVPKTFNEGQTSGSRNSGLSFEIRQVI